MYAKQWRFERVLPGLTVIFGVITLGSGWVHNYGGLVATRLILGLFEGCLFPGLALFVANWYKREELAVRMAFLFGSTARKEMQVGQFLPSVTAGFTAFTWSGRTSVGLQYARSHPLHTADRRRCMGV